jgi:hypothetical protein
MDLLEVGRIILTAREMQHSALSEAAGDKKGAVLEKGGGEAGGAPAFRGAGRLKVLGKEGVIPYFQSIFSLSTILSRLSRIEVGLLSRVDQSWFLP